MIHKILGFALILIILILASCTHPDQDQFTKTHWIVTALNDSSVSTNIGLYFETENEVTFKQSSNSCTGDYSLSGNKLSIVSERCTEMCCDDELSALVKSILSPELDYKIEDKQLFLTSRSGKLVLALQAE